ncbi:alkaline phosphatase D family protein [Phaeocystidibacter marisrubri]|uniref:Alkaline phosphatase family protein n=1 Tax=Phaeocystidibacter marisrubri TaxID=1577780 RepID=A0A6L3ZI79_9FLAO|nr:alkaline phosphatase D family protein [Phaeocystidibacter marisrubri]KAB2817716.1 alkaline phosphatase family protein [Phaeocystidibacter marisrubri]GGH73945.1 hypothetical protein GCM10011318_19410 [Phaeocystidibacter marisrubri]
MTKIQYLSVLASIPLLSFAQPHLQVTIGEVNHREAYFSCIAYDASYRLEFYLSNDNKGVIHDKQGARISYEQNLPIRFTGLTPNQSYDLRVKYANNYAPTDTGVVALASIHTPLDWQHRVPAPDFSFVAGSCNYINEEDTDRPGSPYGGDYEIFTSMAAEDADFTLWLGDNVYQRPSDYSSPSGLSRRFIQDRTNAHLQKLLSTRPNYAILDDHDCGPNDMNSSYFLIDSGLTAFKTFWPRSQYGVRNVNDLRWIQVHSDVVFIGLDNRTHRTSTNSPTPQILGTEQIEWLISQIEFYNRASFFIISIGGQVLNSEAVFETYATYPEEQEYLLDRLASLETNNIIFLTGDRHHSEASSIQTKEGFRIVDLTISPLTSGVASATKGENNSNRIGELIHQRNYALITVKGESGDRVLIAEYKNKDGEEIITYTFRSL